MVQQVLEKDFALDYNPITYAGLKVRVPVSGRSKPTTILLFGSGKLSVVADCWENVQVAYEKFLSVLMPRLDQVEIKVGPSKVAARSACMA
mmetsp:Transcript_588/g.1159  ORF Transcript_588/g.1159 Transcript_588/m.1159 type:complete len:91 (-) Transcript_588:55-327(-)